MASKRKSTIPCMIPVKTMHLRDDVEPNLPCPTTKDSAYLSREDVYSQGFLDLGESSRHDSSGDALKDGGTYTCRPCNFETLDLNLFLDHVYSGHPEFRSDPSFHCVDCGVTAAKFEGLALHNARVHPSTVTTTLQLKKRDRKVTVEQSLLLGPGDSVLSKSESEISITKTPIMKMLKGKSEHKRIVVSHSASDDSRLDAGVSVATGKPTEKKDPPSVTVTHVPTIVHNGSTSKVTLPSAIQIVNGSGALPILKTAVTQVVSVVQNRNLHQQSTPITVSSSPSSSSSSASSKNLPKVMIPLSSIPTYNASMDNSSFLKTSFSKFPYPTKAELCYLTVVTKYPEEQIKIWFTAQRLKQGISWSPEEIEDARRKMFNTIIQTAPPSGHHTQTQQTSSARQAHHSTAQQTITVLPASLGATGIPHILQGSLVSQGGVIVTQPMMANGIQVSSAPVALAVTPKPQSPAKPMMQARPAAALVADKGVSMVVGTVGSSSSLNYTISSSSSNGGVSSSSSSNSSSSSSIMSSSSSSSSSNSSNSGSSSQTSVISAGGGSTTITTTSSSNNSKTSSSSSNNINSNTTRSSNGNKSTENGKSAANGKSTAPSAAHTKTNQDAKSGSNGKDSSSTVKSTNDGKASPDIKTSTDSKISTDAKGDSKTDGKNSAIGSTAVAAATTNSAITTNASSNSNSTSATAANTAASATITTSSSGHSSSNKKGETTTAVATASSPSPSTSTTPSSRTTPSTSALDPNGKQNKKSQEQLSALKQSFLNNQFPNQDEVNRLTSLTGLSVREVRKWFSDRRYHFRNLKGPRTSTGGQASSADKTASPAPASGASGNSADVAPSASADRPKTPPPTPVSPPPQQQQTTSPTTPSRRPPRPPSPDFTAIRYKEREPHQLVALEASFSLDPDPSSEEVDRLRQETKMTRREIHGWFAERRKRAAAEKKKEEAERAEREEAEACMEEGEKNELVKEEDKGEKMDIDEPSGGDAASTTSSSSSQQGKDEKQKEDAPKVNPIKINLKMLKVTESNGKEGEGKEPAQADPPKITAPTAASTTSPIPASSTPYRGKKTADQLHVLKQAFARTQWPGSPQYDELMARTGLPRPEVVRWFGDCRYVLKNGQLKWLESYQTMVEEEDYQKANMNVLKEHLEAHGKLDESQVKELAKGSGLTEDLVRRWFTNRAPLLLAAKKAKEEEEEEEVTDAGTATSVAVEVKEKEPKVEGASSATARQDQGSGSTEKTEKTEKTDQTPPASATSSHESGKVEAADTKSSNPNQGLSCYGSSCKTL